MTDVPALEIKNLHKTLDQNEGLKGISLQAQKAMLFPSLDRQVLAKYFSSLYQFIRNSHCG